MTFARRRAGRTALVLPLLARTIGFTAQARGIEVQIDRRKRQAARHKAEAPEDMNLERDFCH